MRDDIELYFNPRTKTAKAPPRGHKEQQYLSQFTNCKLCRLTVAAESMEWLNIPGHPIGVYHVGCAESVKGSSSKS